MTPLKTIQPSLPLPEPLRGADENSFAQYSVVVRLVDIGRRALSENKLPLERAVKLERLVTEIPSAPIRLLDDTDSPDAAEWQGYISPYLGLDWLQVPWFFAEEYFYRRILEATGYFEPGAGQGVDPFEDQKRLGLETSQEGYRLMSAALNRRLAGTGSRRDALHALLNADLWGNQSDLSLWPAGETGKPDHADGDRASAFLLVDHSEAVLDHLYQQDPQRAQVEFWVDNAGFELVCDLCLADFLLSAGLAATVHLHLKAQPTFVSDAMIKDVRSTISSLSQDRDADVRLFAGRLAGHVESGRLMLDEHTFWTSPLAAWEMPPDLYQRFSQSHLVISKGDANYRRILGDRHWPYTTPIDQIVSYFPAPLLLLRALKSEVAAGLPAA
ncbi:MAG: protein-glutamate O-methyltransferase family protein, partial [Chloroflexota bacterium]